MLLNQKSVDTLSLDFSPTLIYMNCCDFKSTKIILAGLLLALWPAYAAHAQTERTEFFTGITVQPAFEGGTLTSIGFGLKAQRNLLNGDALTVSTGLTRIGTITRFVPPYPSNFAFLPVLIGYQKSVKKFFLEPKIGSGVFSKTIVYDALGHEKVLSNPAFFWGGDAGYRIKRFVFLTQYYRANSINQSELYQDYYNFGYGGVGIQFKLD